MVVGQTTEPASLLGQRAVVVFAILAVALVVYELWPRVGYHGSSSGSFYSDDDGQTYYKDTVYEFPPFEHNGRTASRAFVYSSDKGNFVGLLQRYNASTKKMLDDAYNDYQHGSKKLVDVELMLSSEQVRNGTEAKAPGARDWVPAIQINPGAIRTTDGQPAAMIMP